MKISISRSSLQTTGLFLAVLLYVHTEASEPLLMMLQLFGSLVLLFIYFIIPVFWSAGIALTIRGIIGAAAAASFLSFPLMLPIWHWQDAITKRRANSVIQEAYAYQKQHGHYPESLAQLVPQQISKVPSTGKGLLRPEPFRYKTYYHRPDSTNALAGQRFSLSYYAGVMVEASYNSDSREWHFDD